MDVRCRRCGARVPARDVNLDEMLARCLQCDAVFELRGKATARPAVELPAGMQVQIDRPDRPDRPGDPYRSPGRLRADVLLQWRWYRPRHLLVLGFTLTWWFVLIGWYAIVATTGAPTLMMLVPLLHVAAGLGLAYVSVALLRNRSRLVVTSDRLEVQHEPMPWPGARSVPVAEIEQIYCTEGVAYTVNDHPVPGFSVRARTRHNGDLVLVKNLPEVEQALFIEQTLERALDITDRPVAGEVARA
jgi:hypothetical protein